MHVDYDGRDPYPLVDLVCFDWDLETNFPPQLEAFLGIWHDDGYGDMRYADDNIAYHHLSDTGY